MAILITGGTGFVGRQLQRQLSQRSETLLITSRSAGPSPANLLDGKSRVLQWDPLAEPFSAASGLGPEDAIRTVVNLAGEPVAGGRWTTEKKKRIRDSRVLGTRNLIDGLVQSGQIPEVMISASAVGYYGNRGEEAITEAAPPADDFLGEVCQAWEAEAKRLTQHGTRVVKLRIGIVLGPDGGALKEMLPVFRLGLGGRLGSGKQWFPWIHRNDLVRLIEFCVDHPTLHGPVNATSPNPVRNAEFTSELAKLVHRPALVAVPGFALRLALGEFANTLLASQKVLPTAALSAGFVFEHSELSLALADSM